jgi:hypothetical protein
MEIKKVDKLLPNLNNKEKYVIHHKTLRLTKVHRGGGGKIRRRAMAEKIYPTQYGPAYQRYYGLREGFLQTDEQLGIRENNGKRQE